MNILFLGGYGFLGYNCAQKMSETHTLYVVDRVERKSEIFADSAIIDLNDSKRLFEFIESKKIDVIMHFVSSLIPSSSLEDYYYDIENVYNPTLRILNYCAEHSIRFVYFSSGGAVYGNQKEIFNEKTKREPVSYYGLSKLNFENAINFYCNTKKLKYLIIRPSNPYGKGQNLYGKQGFIAVVIGKILNNETIEVWGDGTAVKDYIYIDDFVYYVNELVNTENAWNSVYNIGSGVGVSVTDVLNAFSSNDIKLPKINYTVASCSDVKRMILDCTKLQDLISHKCIGLEDGIKLFYDGVVNG